MTILYRILNKTLLNPYRAMQLKHRNAYYRAHIRAIGSRVRIGWPSDIALLENVSIGSNVVIHGPVYIWAEGEVTIGSNVAIARGCTILTSNHTIEGDLLPWSEESIIKPVKICDNVWIGANVLILPGVTIHEGAVIGAGSVVTRSIPKCTIAAGNPAKPIKMRDVDRYEKLKANGKFRLIPTHIGKDTLISV